MSPERAQEIGDDTERDEQELRSRRCEWPITTVTKTPNGGKAKARDCGAPAEFTTDDVPGVRFLCEEHEVEMHRREDVNVKEIAP